MMRVLSKEPFGHLTYLVLRYHRRTRLAHPHYVVTCIASSIMVAKISQLLTTNFTTEAIVVLWPEPYPWSRSRKKCDTPMNSHAETMRSAFTGVWKDKGITNLRWPKEPLSCNLLARNAMNLWIQGHRYLYSQSEIGNTWIWTSSYTRYCQTIAPIDERTKRSPQSSLRNRAICLEEVLTKHLSGASQVMKWPEFSKKSMQEIVANTKSARGSTNRSSTWVITGPSWKPTQPLPGEGVNRGRSTISKLRSYNRAPTSTHSWPFQTWAFDLIGPVNPPSKGHI